MPHNIDVYVGQRIRLKRSLLQFSQEELARQLGITFQQVQKYEKGTNRVSASRLFEIAAVLNEPISFFFPEARHNDDVYDLVDDQQMVSLLRSFATINSPLIRKRLVNLIIAMAGELLGSA
jgi:transcriptional regulator with XRE-family HTH domain